MQWPILPAITKYIDCTTNATNIYPNFAVNAGVEKGKAFTKSVVPCHAMCGKFLYNLHKLWNRDQMFHPLRFRCFVKVLFSCFALLTALEKDLKC